MRSIKDAFFADCHRPRAEDGRKGGNGKYACPCCRHFTLDGRANYDICPVCYWEDDGQDDHDADEHHYFSPNHGFSLTEARQNYRDFGASERLMLRHVRLPHADEIPPPTSPSEEPKP